MTDAEKLNAFLNILEEFIVSAAAELYKAKATTDAMTDKDAALYGAGRVDGMIAVVDLFTKTLNKHNPNLDPNLN